ncbi:aminopeptidase P family protein [Limibacter armeniacum]|uniref:aminopeptidase P family protein n=1 Tax=Limibacter armeniacum TaxID=466084 RepID=UPI002FE64DA0
MTINERVAKLRNAMEDKGIAAYIIPSNDPHQSEYPASRWEGRKWISGFTGSAGTAVVTENHAGVWTDGRYFLQAAQELSTSEFELHKQVVAGAPEHIDWLIENLSEGEVIGVDGTLTSLSEYENLKKKLNAKGIQVEASFDLLDEVWDNRPEVPTNPLIVYNDAFAGETAVEKLTRIRNAYQAKGAEGCLITTLDGIAWTLNTRGTDVECNPVAVAWLFVDNTKATLFVLPEKVDAATQDYLTKNGIEVADYHSLPEYLQKLTINKVFVDPDKVGIYYIDQLPKSCKLVKDMSPEIRMKAVKNSAELKSIDNAMVKDGVALTKFHMWLETALGQQALTEYEIVQKIKEFRAQQDNYFGESFGAIVGFKGNGAIIHYSPAENGSATIENEGMLLIDCGGQYFEGTTDITRTLYLGKPSDEQKKHYTLVLKGNIALQTIEFPKGTNGMHLDTLARQFLWQNRLNYGHGTGHGVGMFLNVHEGPLSIRPVTANIPLEPGMIFSNEPGFYEAGSHGIRIENLIVVAERESNDYGDFMGFDVLTYFPISTKLIDKSLMTEAETKWLNDYHQLVFDKLSPKLNEEEKTWLKERCLAL